MGCSCLDNSTNGRNNQGAKKNERSFFSPVVYARECFLLADTARPDDTRPFQAARDLTGR
jgi:hypothetical protein